MKSEWLIVTKIEADPEMTKKEILEYIEWACNREHFWMSTNPRTVTLVRRKKGRARKL